jgi:hypothetical protein
LKLSKLPAATLLERTQHRNNGGRGKRDGKSRFRQRSTAHANASHSNNVICYNCGEPGHIPPKCPHAKPKAMKSTQRVSLADSSASNEETSHEHVCSARIINYNNNSEEILFENDERIRATSLPNINYYDDTSLTAYLDNSLFVSMCFETYEYFKKYNIRDTKDGNFTLHDRPMEEDLLDFAAIFKLEFTDTVSQACRQILRQAASCQQPKHGSAPNPGKIL